jgi:hypothetical protein
MKLSKTDQEALDEAIAEVRAEELAKKKSRKKTKRDPNEVRFSVGEEEDRILIEVHAWLRKYKCWVQAAKIKRILDGEVKERIINIGDTNAVV